MSLNCTKLVGVSNISGRILSRVKFSWLVSWLKKHGNLGFLLVPLIHESRARQVFSEERSQNLCQTQAFGISPNKQTPTSNLTFVLRSLHCRSHQIVLGDKGPHTHQTHLDFIAALLSLLWSPLQGLLGPGRCVFAQQSLISAQCGCLPTSSDLACIRSKLS